MNTERPQLGDWLTVSEALERRRPRLHGGAKKRWVSRPIKPTRMMYIGYRTLSNGDTEYDNVYGNIYWPKEYFEAWMFVEDERRKPVFVRPESVSLYDAESEEKHDNQDT